MYDSELGAETRSSTNKDIIDSDDANALNDLRARDSEVHAILWLASGFARVESYARTKPKSMMILTSKTIVIARNKTKGYRTYKSRECAREQPIISLY